MWRYLRDTTFSHFDTILECDRHTHTKTDTRRRHIPRLAKLSRGNITKPRLVASYDIRAWKRSGTILGEWEGMKSKKIDEA